MGADAALFQKFGRSIPVGTVLFREGEESREMYVIHAGQVRITKHIRGQEKVLATLGQGEFFGEMAVLNNKPRSATATVVEDAEMLVIEPKTFESMVRASTEIALRMIKRMAARLQEADDHIENLMLRDPSSRVVHFLVRQSRLHGEQVPWVPEDMPGQIGLSLEEVQAVYDRLNKKKLIAVDAQGTRILDAGKLDQFLEFLAMREQFGDDL
jgi:CRP/FNR family transcriptional regulator, cyclic AMP receptor protein